MLDEQRVARISKGGSMSRAKIGNELLEFQLLGDLRHDVVPPRHDFLKDPVHRLLYPVGA